MVQHAALHSSQSKMSVDLLCSLPVTNLLYDDAKRITLLSNGQNNEHTEVNLTRKPFKIPKNDSIAKTPYI